MATVKLTKALIDALEPGPRRTYLWDSEITGLGLRVSPGGRLAFVLSYRTRDGTKRQPVIGTYGTLTVVQARDLARDWLVEVRRGGDPSQARQEARAGETVADLCHRYLTWATVAKKAGSRAMDERMIERFIRPRWGKAKVTAIGARDAEELHASLAATPILANRVRALVSCLFSLAARWRMHPGPNPARHVERYPERVVHRPLGADELEGLGEELRACRELADEDLAVVDMLELLVLTGCRRNEIVTLTWAEVDLEAGLLRLRDSKSGPRVVWLGQAAVAILERQEHRVDERGRAVPWVFPSGRTGRPWRGLQKAWSRIRSRAGLGDVRLHDLRHTTGAAAAAQGLGQAQIGQLLGHRNLATTGRYSEPHRGPAAAAAQLVDAALARALSGGRVVDEGVDEGEDEDDEQDD